MGQKINLFFSCSDFLARKYTKKHEWVSVDSEKIGTIGVTDYAQVGIFFTMYLQTSDTFRKYL